jgi:hypothetical protein
MTAPLQIWQRNLGNIEGARCRVSGIITPPLIECRPQRGRELSGAVIALVLTVWVLTVWLPLTAGWATTGEHGGKSTCEDAN